MKLHAVGWSLFFAYSGTFFKKKWLVLSCTVSYNHAKETASPILREAVLTTFLTIDSSGTRGNSGTVRFEKHGIRSRKHQKRTEKIRKKFHQFFGTRMPRVRVSPLGLQRCVIVDTNGYAPFYFSYWKSLEIQSVLATGGSNWTSCCQNFFVFSRNAPFFRFQLWTP